MVTGTIFPATPHVSMEAEMADELMQQFETGATRSADGHKNDYEGYLSPIVLEAYGDYMTSHRKQRDGKLRDSDNWQRGMPQEKYLKSLVRHTFDLWKLKRGFKAVNPDTNEPVTIKEACCAIMFNVMGLLFEHLIQGSQWQRPGAEAQSTAVVPNKAGRVHEHSPAHDWFAWR